MNTDAFSISDAYVSVGGDNGIHKSIDDFAHKWVGTHYMIAFGALILLTIVVLWLGIWKCKEHFNPTQNLRDQDSDQFGLGKREYLDQSGADRSQSAFAQQVQGGGGGQFVVDPNAKGNAPGSLAYQVLHSADFNCAGRKMSNDDAWSWMSGVAHESMRGDKPKNDNDFSRVLAGQ